MSGNRRRADRAFSLVELMVTIAVVGILAVIALAGVSRYLASAKQAEAKSAVARLGQLASASYSRDKISGLYLAPGGSASISQALCLTAATSVPSSVPSGGKYVSGPTDWSAGDSSTGWKCLQFEMLGPQYFQYGYTADALGTSFFSAVAVGDLSGNGNQISYSFEGRVVSGNVILAPAVLETALAGGGGGGGCSALPGGRGSVGWVALAIAVLVAVGRRHHLTKAGLRSA